MNNDYSSKDFTSIYEDLLAIVEASTTIWNPRYSTEADPGVVILKAMALLEDKSNYRFDMSRAQAYLDTVSDRSSAYDLLSMLGYVMKGSRAAEGFVTVTNTTDNSYTIPQFSVITNPTKQVNFFTKEAVTVEPGEAKSIQVQAGSIFQIVKQGIQEFTLKDIDERGRLFLGKTNLAQNGVYIVSSTPTTKWIYLDYVLLREISTYYMVCTSETGEVYIQFPDDFASLVGRDLLKVYATYTNGANSNISKNTLTTFLDNQPVGEDKEELFSIFTVSQPEDIYSGQDEETIEHAVQTYYETKDVCSTLVTAQDFITALRYLLLGNSRVFSNVIVETPQTKTMRMMTVQQGVAYTQLVKPKDLDYNRIDVLPLRSSTDYYTSFKPYLAYTADNYSAAKSMLETQIDEKLIDQKALPVSINIAGYEQIENDDGKEWVVDYSIQPILATFSPEIYVYLRDNTLTQQIIAREAIKRYFQTTYNMKNLFAGESLSETQITRDIKSLSTNILDVIVLPLNYSMKQFSPQYLMNPSAVFDPETSIRAIDKYDEMTILSDAVLAGDTPLFKYANRQNSYSKTNSLYSALLPEEQVLPIPWGATTYGGEVNFPQGCELKATHILGGDLQKNSHVLTIDEMVQVRRPVFTQLQGWSTGTAWTYTLKGYQASSYNTVLNENKICYLSLNGDKGIKLPATTTFRPAQNIMFPRIVNGVDLLEYFTEAALPSQAGQNLVFKAGRTYTVAEAVTLSGGYLPLREFNWGGSPDPTYYLLPPEEQNLPMGSPYVLQPDEQITIRKASSQEVLATLVAGDVVLLEGVEIQRAPSASGVLTSPLTTISKMGPKVSTISSEYVYFLCLNSTDFQKELTVDTPYTLEEGEYFIYADAGVTEYVTLGPGTEIFLPEGSRASVTLEAHSNYDIAAIAPTDFKPLPATLGANFYEITTFIEGDTIKLKSGLLGGFFTTKGGYYLPTWKNTSAEVEFTLQDGSKSSYIISEDDYSIRHLAILRTLPEGYAITKSSNFELSDEENTLPFNRSDGSAGISRLYSSIAVSGFAGSLLTSKPIRVTTAEIGLDGKGQEVLFVTKSVPEGSSVQVKGVRKDRDSLIPSPYDLSITFSGTVNKDPTTIAAIPVPPNPDQSKHLATLFHVRTFSATDDTDVELLLKLNWEPDGVQEGSSAEVIFTNSTVQAVSVDNIFVMTLPPGAKNATISVQLASSNTTYDGNNPYSIELLIEDISILDASTPLDPKLGITCKIDDLLSMLNNKSVTITDEDTEKVHLLLTNLSNASTQARESGKSPFNWLYYSLDRLDEPLDPRSFFISSHPKHDKVFPLYIEDPSLIRFPRKG